MQNVSGGPAGKRRACALFAATLIGCSMTLPNAAAAETRLVVIGDSNVEGREVEPASNYTGQLQYALRQQGRNVIVINKGVRGDTIPGVLRRLERDVPAGADAAVIWIGINDLRRGATVAQVASGHRAIVARLQARGIKSYVIAPPAYDINLHRNPATRISVIDPHLNAAGYAQMLKRTYPQIVRLLSAAPEQRRSSR